VSLSFYVLSSLIVEVWRRGDRGHDAVDLLQKSDLFFEFNVVDPRDQVALESKPSAPVSAPPHQDPEDLQPADHVFACDAPARQFPIRLPLGFAQGLPQRLLPRRLTVRV
jgi:hypothetical protein